MPTLPICGLVLFFLQATPDPSFDDLSTRAAAALEHQPEEAATLYKQALAIRPNWAEGWFYLGADLSQLGRYTDAKEALLKGIALSPGKGTPWGVLGICEYELADYENALIHIRKAESIGLADNPGFITSVRYRAALMYLRRSEFRLAIDQLRPLAALGPAAPPVIEALGAAVLGRQNPSPTLTPAQRALYSLAGRATWAFFAQHPEEASSGFQQLTEQFPNEPGVHYATGIFLLDRDPDAALAEFQKEVKIRPDSVTALLQIASIELKSGNADSALVTARQAVKLEPANFLSQVTLARALLTKGQPKEAIAPLEAAVKLAPDYPESHFYLEQAYRKVGRGLDAKKQKAEFNRLRSLQDPLNLAPTALTH